MTPDIVTRAMRSAHAFFAAGSTASRAIPATVFCCATLAGCGGGSDTAASQEQAAPAQQLAAYLGTWTGTCEGESRETTTFTRVSADTLNIAFKIDYYAQPDCQGTIVATETPDQGVTMTYTDTVEVSLAVPPATSPSATRLDRVALKQPAYSVTVTGPGVTRESAGAVMQSCFTTSSGARNCYPDGRTAPVASANRAVHVSGNRLHVYRQDGAAYTLEETSTRAM